MRILFDQGVPRGLAWTLREHEVTEARKFGWEKVTTNKNLRYQHQIESRAFRQLQQFPVGNLSSRMIALVVLGQSPWRLVPRHLDVILETVNASSPGSFAEVAIPFE